MGTQTPIVSVIMLTVRNDTQTRQDPALHKHTHEAQACYTKLQIKSSCDRSQISPLRFKSTWHWNINNIPESSLKEITSHNSTKDDIRVMGMVLRTISQN